MTTNIEVVISYFKIFLYYIVIDRLYINNYFLQLVEISYDPDITFPGSIALQNPEGTD